MCPQLLTNYGRTIAWSYWWEDFTVTFFSRSVIFCHRILTLVVLMLLFVSIRVFLSHRDDWQPHRQNWKNEKYVHQVTYSCTSLVLVEDAGEIDYLYHHNTLTVYLTIFMRLPVLSHWLSCSSPHIRGYIFILPVSFCIDRTVSSYYLYHHFDSCPNLRIPILSLYHVIK